MTSAINVLGLTLGLSSILFIYVQEKYERSFDKNQPNADQIYRVNLTMTYPNRVDKDGNTQSMLVKAMRNEFPELEAVTELIGPQSSLVKINPGETNEKIFEEKRNLFLADSLFLKYFEYDFVAGNPKTALDSRNAIILSTDLVEKYYQDYVGREMDLLGKRIDLYDSVTVYITGVIKDPPSNSMFPFAMLGSAEIYYRQNEWDRDNWGNISSGMTYAVLKPGQNPEEIERKFPDLVNKYRKEEAARITSYSLLNLKELHEASEWGYAGNYTSESSMSLGFIAVGLFIMLSACINFINLQTAQSINRAKEVGIRKVMGGTRLQIITQYLIETAILTFISFLLALWITEIALNGWNDLLSIVRMDAQLDGSVIVLGLVLIALVSLIAGLYPAIKLSSFEPSESLRSGFSLLAGKKDKLSLRQILVLTQFIITQVMVIGTIVIAFQMDYFINKDLGFDKENMVTITTYKPDKSKIDRLVQGISEMPEVSSFSFSSGPPMDAGRYGTAFKEVGNEEKGEIKTRNKFMDHRFLDNYNIELAAGRNFREDEYNDTINAFIVNETLVRLLDVEGPEEAIGKVLDCYGVKARIVGVTKDFHIDKMSLEIEPLIMFPVHWQVNGADLRISGNNLPQALDKLRVLWAEVFPTRVFEFMTVDDFMLQAYIVEDIMLKSIRIFTILAILIGCLGLYGLVSFISIRKTKEVGIRKVLGASYGQILYLFSRRFFVLTIVAFAISAPLAYQAMKLWLSNYVYRIDLDWKIFAFGFVITLLLTLITVGYISLRTAKTNPAETLQFE